MLVISEGEDKKTISKRRSDEYCKCQTTLRRGGYKPVTVGQSNEISDPSTTTPYALLIAADLETVINQVLSRQDIAFSSTLFVKLGSSFWFINSGCFNLMTPNTTFLCPEYHFLIHLLFILLMNHH